MSKSRFSKNKGSKKSSNSQQSSSYPSGSMPPPPPQRSRSFEELRNQVESLKTQNERLRAQMDSKPQPSADEIAKRNPTRANPNPSNPEIKLEQYATDWLEEEHTNVLVDLNEDFEDYTISEHATIL